MKALKAERKYIIECHADEWDGKFTRSIARWYWTKRLERWSEGKVLKEYRELVRMSKPLAWLNGGKE